MIGTLERLPTDPQGHEYGTADQLAARITSPEKPVTAALIRKWAWRSRNPHDRLHGLLPAIRVPGRRTGRTYYRVDDAYRVAAMIETGIR